jgi:arylsulfatase A-like enzyme
VLIIVDDLGYGDLGCYGGTDIPTPHIDSIARAGVRFTQAYAYPTCSPTRAALLTGRYAERLGISRALMSRDARAVAGAVTLPQLLRDRGGYVTGIVGKWHLGYGDAVSPTRKGFDEFFGFRGGKIDFFKHTDAAQKDGTKDGKHDLWEGERRVPRKGYTTDLFTGRARQFIRDHAPRSAEKPFFLYLAYNAPHYARKNVWQAPKAYLERFGAEGKTKGRGVYRAVVACVDDGVGAVLGELAAQRVDGDTLVIFMSDNGAEPPGSNEPLSGGKHGHREGGVRVPWVARWPGVIPPDSRSDAIVHAIDVLPSLLAAANVRPPDDLKLDGRDVWPAFTGSWVDPPVPRPIHFSGRALRAGRWKLLNDMLFDLETDPGERTDLAAVHPEVRDALAAQVREWAASMGIKPSKRAARSRK